MLRIIDNKRVELTDSEWLLYQEICRSYTEQKTNLRGEDLFKDLFESDKNGIIVFLRPPTNYTSIEVFMFLVSVMVHQHIGAACAEADASIKEIKENIHEGRRINEEAKVLIEEMKKLRGL